MKCHRPGIEKHRLDIKNHEDEGKHIVADVELNPSTANGFHPRFVGGVSFETHTFGSQDLRCTQCQNGHETAQEKEA